MLMHYQLSDIHEKMLANVYKKYTETVKGLGKTSTQEETKNFQTLTVFVFLQF